MRHVTQPGPPAAERIAWTEGRGRAFTLALEAGGGLLEALWAGFAREGFSGGVVNLEGGALAPLAYVMPALSDTPARAAFYSETFRPAGTSRIEAGAVTLGTREGRPFFHAHALWREADGSRRGGHLLPEETRVAEPFSVRALGLQGAGFTVAPDPETGFGLFGPTGAPDGAADAPDRVFAIRLRPNQDLCGALEGFCARHGIARAEIHGGVGSIVGARFADGSGTDAFATEMAVVAGRIAPGEGGAPRAEVEAVLVDYTGGLFRGTLVRGDNPVLMTLEVALRVT